MKYNNEFGACIEPVFNVIVTFIVINNCDKNTYFHISQNYFYL